MSGLSLCSWFDCEGRYVCFCRYLIRPRINGETEIKERMGRGRMGKRKERLQVMRKVD